MKKRDYRKLVIGGGVGAGKTQLVSTLSQIDPLRTEVDSSVDIGKQTTTVGIDYGRINLTENAALGLYGLPGQERFSFVWDIVGKSLWGLFILVKYEDDASLDDFERLMTLFLPKMEGVAFAVGITHCEGVSKESIQALQKSLLGSPIAKGLRFPIIHLDPRDLKSSVNVLHVLNAINSSFSK